jgi:Mn2+/Fe2+ NRAMP family transporter
MNNFGDKFNRHFYIFVFLVTAAFYYALLFSFKVQTDIQKHIDFPIAMLHGVYFPPTFLYYSAICIVALFRDDFNSLLFASLLVLSFAVAFKFLITVRLFAEQTHLNHFFNERKAYLISNIVGVCLITAFCI